MEEIAFSGNKKIKACGNKNKNYKNNFVTEVKLLSYF